MSPVDAGCSEHNQRQAHMSVLAILCFTAPGSDSHFWVRARQGRQSDSEAVQEVTGEEGFNVQH